MVKELAKGRVCMTHGYGQQYGDCLRVGTGWRWAKEEKVGTSVKHKQWKECWFLSIIPEQLNQEWDPSVCFCKMTLYLEIQIGNRAPLPTIWAVFGGILRGGLGYCRTHLAPISSVYCILSLLIRLLSSVLPITAKPGTKSTLLKDRKCQKLHMLVREKDSLTAQQLYTFLLL